MQRFSIRSIALLIATILVNAGWVSAQSEPLPARALHRFGTIKLRHGSRIQCLAYSHDGNVLAAGGSSDPVRLWNPKTGELIRTLGETSARSLAFSPSGETMLFGGDQRVVRMWNFRLNKETGRLDGHRASITAITVAPDASTIVTASDDGAIYLWDMNTKSKVGELMRHTGEVNALIYYLDADNNGFLISAGADRRIVVWNMNSDPPAVKYDWDAGCVVNALAITADDKTFYSAGDDHLIRRWDLATRRQTGTFKGHDGIVTSLALRGDTLISASYDSTVRFWNVKTTEQLRSLKRGLGDCEAFAVTKAGDFVACAGSNNTIRIFDADKLKEAVPAQGNSALAGLALSPDNLRAATAGADGRILVWDAPMGKPGKAWESKQTGDLLVAFADNQTLVSAGSNVRIWTVDGNPRATIDLAKPAVALATSPDGKAFAVGLPGGEIELWDVNGKKRGESFTYPGPLHALAWSPDGKKLAAGGGAKIVVWNPDTKAVLKSFDVNEDVHPTEHTIRCLAFGPDSVALAAGWYTYARVRIYNLDAKKPADAKEQRRFEGHQSAVNAVAFSADGRSLVTGGFDGSVRLWEAFSGKQIAHFDGHFGEVTGVAFARNGLSAFSAGVDTVAYRWGVPGILKNGKLPDLTLGVDALDDAWTTLISEDTARGHEVMWQCIASGKQAVPHLAKKFEPMLVDPEKVRKLFKDLDSSHYPTRVTAMNELPKYGRWMEGRFDKAIANPSSLEYKRRLQELKDKVRSTSTVSLDQERLRLRRIMLMCEYVGGADAVTALRRLAEQGPEEEIQAEARASIARMTRK